MTNTTKGQVDNRSNNTSSNRFFLDHNKKNKIPAYSIPTIKKAVEVKDIIAKFKNTSTPVIFFLFCSTLKKSIKHVKSIGTNAK